MSLIKNDFDNGAFVHASGPHEIIHHAEDHDGTQDERAVVHRRRRGRGHGGPEAEEDDDQHVGACERVDRDPEHARNPPRTPRELWGFTRGRGDDGAIGKSRTGRGWERDCACAAAPE